MHKWKAEPAYIFNYISPYFFSVKTALRMRARRNQMMTKMTAGRSKVLNLYSFFFLSPFYILPNPHNHFIQSNPSFLLHQGATYVCNVLFKWYLKAWTFQRGGAYSCACHVIKHISWFLFFFHLILMQIYLQQQSWRDSRDHPSCKVLQRITDPS